MAKYIFSPHQHLSRCVEFPTYSKNGGGIQSLPLFTLLFSPLLLGDKEWHCLHALCRRLFSPSKKITPLESTDETDETCFVGFGSVFLRVDGGF
jgi:hypothetical protein